MQFTNSGDNSRNDDLFSPGKSQDEIKKNFLDYLYRAERQPDSLTSIQLYKRLLKVNAALEQQYYEEILINLCRHLEKNKLYGEELYYRLVCRYYFDNIQPANQGVFNEEKLKEAYTNIIIDLGRNPGKLKILIIDTELPVFQSIIEIIKATGNQQPYVFPGIESLLSSNDKFLNNFDLLISFNQNPGNTLETIKIFKEKHNKSKLFAVYCPSREIAKNIYHKHWQEIDYVLYSETMIYAILHIALKNLESFPIYQGKNGDNQ